MYMHDIILGEIILSAVLYSLGKLHPILRQSGLKTEKMAVLNGSMFQIIAALFVLAVVIVVVGMGWWHKREKQRRQAEETARMLYGVGKQTYKPPPVFSFNMSKVIKKFKGQRYEDTYQFAVLFFVQQEIKRLEELKVGTNCIFKSKGNQTLCNYDETFWPKTENFSNYMVARYDETLHAEAILLDKFDDLWEKYLHLNQGEKPSFVVLYSWIMPCRECTDKLLGVLKDKYIPTQFVVSYTLSCWTKESPDIAERSRESLRSAGISVYNIEYDKYLPSGEQPAPQSNDFRLNPDDFPPLYRKDSPRKRPLPHGIEHQASNNYDELDQRTHAKEIVSDERLQESPLQGMLPTLGSVHQTNYSDVEMDSSPPALKIKVSAEVIGMESPQVGGNMLDYAYGEYNVPLLLPVDQPVKKPKYV